MSTLRPEPRRTSTAVVRLVYFAAAAMVLSGAVHVVQGTAALRGDEVLSTRPTYLDSEPGPFWGWLHVAIGVVLVATAVGVLLGSPRALAGAAGITVVAAVASFVFIPFYPTWGVVSLLLNGTALYAIGTVGTTGRWAKTGAARPPQTGGLPR